MTRRPPDGPWDDERLRAAFEARAADRAPSAPSDLAPAVMRAVRADPRRASAAPRSKLLAAAAVVVVLIGGLAVGLPTLEGPMGSRTSPSPGSTGPAPSDPMTRPSTPSGASGTVLGLPVISVAEAIPIRDTEADDRELAVHGWFAALAVPCPSVVESGVPSPLRMACPDEFAWLMDRPEPITLEGTAGPTGPAVHPLFDDVEADPGVGGSPREMTVLGHFDDRRADLCPDAELAACRDRFVVDRVAVVDGSDQPNGVFSPDGVAPRSTDDDIAAIVGREAPNAPLLSVAVLAGSTHLPHSEPSLAIGSSPITGYPAVWSVRVLEDGHAITYLVVDGTDAIFEMNPDNEPVAVGGSLPAAPPSGSLGWPPADTTVLLTLTGEVAAGQPPAQVAVVDRSSHLVAARERTAADPMVVGSSSEPAWIVREPGGPVDRIRLGWVGGVCDSRITVTIDPDALTVAIDAGPRPPCDLIGIDRELVLDFDRAIDPASVHVTYTDSQVGS